MTPGPGDRRRAVVLLLTITAWSVVWGAGLALVPPVLVWPAAVLFFTGLGLIPWSLDPRAPTDTASSR
jgi:hypothetical protein